jgi:hypothetical protein
MWQEAIPLMVDNHAETGALPQEKFNPSLTIFQQVEAAGALQTYTMRLIGALVGYAAFVITPHPTYSNEIVATSHVVYVTPAHRGRRSIRFLLWIKAQLAALGANYWGLQCPTGHDWTRTLAWLGLRPVETVYMGELK